MMVGCNDDGGCSREFFDIKLNQSTRVTQWGDAMAKEQEPLHCKYKNFSFDIESHGMKLF